MAELYRIRKVLDGFQATEALEETPSVTFSVHTLMNVRQKSKCEYTK